MNNIENFVCRMFGLSEVPNGKHFVETTDKTVWFKVNPNNGAMLVPPMKALKVNYGLLSQFTVKVEMHLVTESDNKLIDWEHLDLFEYSNPKAIQAGLQYIINGSFPFIACDIESKHLAWDGNKLLSIGFATDENTCHAFYNIPDDLYPMLEQALNKLDTRYIWHNGKFDKNTLWYTCGIHVRVDEDTMLKHHIQVTEKSGTHRLKTLAPLYLGAPQWDDELDKIKKEYCRKNKVKLADFTYDLIPTEILIPYMQMDCIATYRLFFAFDLVKEDGTDDIYRAIVSAVEAFSCMEYNGAKVDQAHLEELAEQFTEELAHAVELQQPAIDYYWNPVQYSNDTGAKLTTTFNSGSPKQLKWFLGTVTGLKLPDTSAATINDLLEKVESGSLALSEVAIDFFKGLSMHRKASKYMGTYVTGMQNAMRVDGRVSGGYNLHGTETGRLSSSNPK